MRKRCSAIHNLTVTAVKTIFKVNTNHTSQSQTNQGPTRLAIKHDPRDWSSTRKLCRRACWPISRHADAARGFAQSEEKIEFCTFESTETRTEAFPKVRRGTARQITSRITIKSEAINNTTNGGERKQAVQTERISRQSVSTSTKWAWEPSRKPWH